jgi:PAS domain S-box-containing protein
MSQWLLLITRLNTKAYLWRSGGVVLALLVAAPLQAQSLVGGYSDVVGIGAMGGIIVFLLAWTQSLRMQLRRHGPQARVRETGPANPAQEKAELIWDDEHEILQTLLEHASDQIYFKDRDSKFRWCCKAVCDRFGVKHEEIVGKSDFDFFDDAHARPAFEDEQEILRTGLPFYGKIEKEVMKDGSVLWALTSKMPLRNKAGEIIGTFGISKDISDLKRTETQLEYERDFLTSIMSNTPDLVYFKDLQSRFVRVSQSEAVSALERARAKHQANSKDDSGSLPAHLASPSEFAQYLLGKTDFDFYPEDRARSAFEDEQEIIRTGLTIVGKLESNLGIDGKVTWLLTTKMPWRTPNGEIIGTFGISKDVTFLKEAEAKLEIAHKQLVESSRVAGMAEVATTVLHNVGNVLNSVNISASLVADKVKNSKTANLGRVAEMLQDHAANLADFLTHDPKGSKLPSYFATLAENLAAEQNEMLAELSSLCANIEHIKEIVAMQQAYAKVAGLQETLKAADLIEDALRLNAGAVERHHVQVIREFSETPPILVDKHKVLQILVNLMRNAKYALENRDPGDKRMILRTEPGENQTVRISVIDNGVGIAPENMTRIFEHGFTTRQNGHGFALHSGALAAREMGGSLTGHSAGPGQGATFTLELPLRPPEAAA